MGIETGFPKSVQPGMPRLGVLPVGWLRAPLGDFLEEVKRPIKMNDETEYDLVTVKRSRGGVVRREHLLGKEISVKSQFYIETGDFLISKRQIVHGACGVVPKEMSGSIVSNEYSVLIVKKPIDIQFLSYLSESIYFQQTCFHSSIGVHVEKMIFKLDRWLKWPFNLPLFKEQVKISQVLTTWSKAIETSERLLDNYQQQKKVLMRQLLTGKKRFSGYKNKWKEIQLSFLGETFSGLSGKNKNDFGKGKPFIPYINIFKYSMIKTSEFLLVNIARGEKQSQVKYGDIFFTTSSETIGEVGMSSVLLEEVGEVYLNSFCFGFRLNDFTILLPEYARYLFRSAEVRQKIIFLGQGSIRFNLSKTRLLQLKLLLPTIKEQKDISYVLSSADKEIEIIQQKIDSLKQEKKALMQLLLTGKKRVKF